LSVQTVQLEKYISKAANAKIVKILIFNAHYFANKSTDIKSHTF